MVVRGLEGPRRAARRVPFGAENDNPTTVLLEWITAPWLSVARRANARRGGWRGPAHGAKIGAKNFVKFLIEGVESP